MISPKIKNKLSKTPHATMRPIHLRLSETIITHLEETATERGFNNIQSLIRLYIRQGLDRDNANYTLAQDLLFIEKLQRKGVPEHIIKEALLDTNSVCDNE